MTLVEIFEKNKIPGKDWCYTDKWLPMHSYLGYYDTEMAPYKKNVRLLEIGVCWGSSINLFSEYFENYKIDGVDITSDYLNRPGNEHNKKQLNENPNVNVHFGINSRESKIADMLYEDETFDIIVEDGDHSEDAQFETLVAYLPKLKKTGVYFMEDVFKNVIPSLLNRIKEKYGDTVEVSIYHGLVVDRIDDMILKITYTDKQ